MQRVREAPPAPQESTPSLQDTPELVREARPLLERLAALRAPGVTSEEIDQFLAGLAAPRPSNEPPRVRADLMLDVLEDEWLCELRGSAGRRMGAVALEALLGLGYPYALEVTPEMLAQARGSPPARFPLRPLLGLGLAGVNVLLPLAIEASGMELPPLVNLFPTLFDNPFLLFRRELWLVCSSMLLGPPLLSVLAGWYKAPRLKSLFNGLQWLLTGYLFLVASQWLQQEPIPGILHLLTALISLATVLCLTPPKEPET
jgi:hypothetical protein